MGRKHLHELLKEDQEPFHLKSFIADRRSLLKSTTTDAPKTALQPRKRNRVIQSTSSATARNYCLNHACLFSFQDSPEYKNSPFLDFPTTERKSPCKNTAVFLHIPASTAAMLLDAAMRVQKPKSGSKHIGFGLLGSFLRRLKDRSTRAKGREIGPVNVAPSSPPGKSLKTNVNSGMEVNGGGDVKGLFYPCNNNGSGNWSEKSLEMETSCRSRSIHDSLETECLCSGTLSPFRFSLQRSPSPPRLKPDSSSPVASPSRHFQQDEEESCDGERPHVAKDDEKEQCSPVSILDPLFDDDDDGAVMEEDDYDIRCSYAIVQRAKHELLQKLQRFERLAGLDPIVLEKHMLEQCYDGDDDEDEDEDVMVDGEFVREVVDRLGVGKIPWYMKKLLLDLIAEEKKNQEQHVVVQRVCSRLHSWKVVELNTIDMMVEADFINEGWNRCDEEMIREIGMDIEGAIFGFLVEELAEEIVNSSKNNQ